MKMTRPVARSSRLPLVALGVLVAAIALAACGGDDDGDGDGGGEEKVTVGLTSIGPRNDKAFSQSHLEGLEEAERQIPGVELTSVLDSRETPQSRIDAFETLAPNNNLVVGASATYAPVADQVAPQFPDTYFIPSAGATEQFHDNVTSIVPDEGLPAYVAGVVMAQLTQTDTIGVIGGAEIPPTDQTVAGVREGARTENPNIEVLENVIGNFNDAAKAKEAANAMIDDGADQIFGFLDAGIVGMYEAAEEAGGDIDVYNIIVPDCESYPNIVGTATLSNVTAMQRVVQDFVDDRLEPGAIFIGLDDPELQDFVLCPKFESQAEIKSAVEQTIEQINSGELEVPPDVVNPRPDYEFTEAFPK